MKIDEMPVIDCGTLSFDRADFDSVRKDTSAAAPLYDRCPAPLEMLEGTAVKTYQKDLNFPVCGRISKKGDTYVVVGYGWLESPSEIFVWRGTKDEFARTWVCD